MLCKPNRLAAGIGHLNLPIAPDFAGGLCNEGKIVAGVERLFPRRIQIGQEHAHLVARNRIALPEIEEVAVHVCLTRCGLFIYIDSRRVRFKFLSKR